MLLNKINDWHFICVAQIKFMHVIDFNSSLFINIILYFSCLCIGLFYGYIKSFLCIIIIINYVIYIYL